MKKLFSLLVLLSITAVFGQVGINTETPTETLDVNGTLRVRVADQMTMTELATSDSILVVSSTGVVKRIPSINVVTQAANTGATGVLPVKTDGTVVIGNGTDTNKITLGQQGATSGQFLAWNGSSWGPTTLSVNGVESVTLLVDNGDGTFSYTNENNVKVTIEKASLKDNGDGTYTFSNNNGSDITFDVNDADADPENEIQDLSLDTSTNILKITKNGSATNIDLSTYLDNTDDQTITTFELGTDNVLTLTLENGGTKTVDLGSYVNTDTQDLSIDSTGKIISLTDGGSVTVNTDDADADPENEIQDLSLDTSTNILKITKNGSATNIDLSTYLDNTDDQTITTFELGADNVLTLTLENGGTKTVDLGSYVNTDTQDLSIDSTGKIISLTDGGSVTVNTDDADANPTNENQTVSAGTGITVTQTGQDFNVVNSAPDQTVTLTGAGISTISGTYPNFTITSTEVDGSTTNELSDLQLSGSTLSLTNPATTDNSVDLSSLMYKHIAINEFVRAEPVLQDKGRIMFTVPPDLAGYKTDKMTCSVRELGTAGVTVSALYWRNGIEGTIGETATIPTSAYTATSAGGSAITLAEGDLIYLNITAAPAFSNAPKGLSCTIKLLP